MHIQTEINENKIMTYNIPFTKLSFSKSFRRLLINLKLNTSGRFGFRIVKTTNFSNVIGIQPCIHVFQLSRHKFKTLLIHLFFSCQLCNIRNMKVHGWRDELSYSLHPTSIWMLLKGFAWNVI